MTETALALRASAADAPTSVPPPASASAIPRAYTRPLTRLITLYNGGIKLAKRALLIVSLAISGCRSQLTPASPTPEIGRLRLLTDSATAPLLRDLVSHYRPAHLLISWDINVVEPPAMRQLLESGRADFAITSFVPNDALENGSLWATPLGEDAIAVVVNPANLLTALAAADLRAIWQGRISDWSAFGGESLPITVVTQPPESSSARNFQAFALGDRPITPSARLAPHDAAVIDIVAATPGAIGFISMGYIDDRVKALALDGVLPSPQTVSAGQYPLRSPILIVGRTAPADDDYRDFFAWTQSPEGQAIVSRKYGALN
ncbi:MAG: substrate-binding domain-containing protein [Anaerolineae bacterium]|nr:substrate-binding domain-containing protein [Anaerolineae bacterium]